MTGGPWAPCGCGYGIALLRSSAFKRERFTIRKSGVTLPRSALTCCEFPADTIQERGGVSSEALQVTLSDR